MMEIKKYQDKVNIILDKFIENDVSNTRLKDMVSWSLKGGKRLRSMIVLDIANSINKVNNLNIDVSKVSISCELLHTASLIIDDLPCMDNDEYRRNIETIHFKYGENNAIILSTFLLSQVGDLLHKNIEEIKNIFAKEYFNTIREMIFNNYLKNYNTAILGQYIDIYPLKKSKEENIRFSGTIKEKYLRKIIIDKTAPFFEMAFIGGYILSGGDNKNYNKVRKVSQLFGIIFQISDDFEDQDQDSEKGCYSLIQNYVIVLGKEKALKDFYKLINIFISYMKELKLYSKLFENIIEYLLKRVEKYK